MVAAAALCSAIVASPTVSYAAEHHARGIVLGWTANSIDVGLPDRRDVHFDMAEQPVVVLARGSSVGAIVRGVRLALVKSGGKIVAAAVVARGVRLFADGRMPWDRPANATLSYGRVTSRTTTAHGIALTLAFARGGESDVIPINVPIVVLEPSSRRALLSPQSALIVARPEDDGISDYAERIVLGEDAVTIPF